MDKVTNLSDKKYFSQLPHIIFDKNLTHTEFRLWCYYNRVGSCWQSAETTAEGAGMSVGSVSAARKGLATKELITCKKNKHGGYNILVADLWPENMQKYGSKIEPHVLEGSEFEPPLQNLVADPSKFEAKNNTLRITHKEEREIPAPAKKQTPPAQQAPSLSPPPSGQPKQAVTTSDPFTAVSPSTAKLVGQPKHLAGFTSTWDNAPEQQEARTLAKIYTGRPEDYLPIAEYLVTLQDCELGRSELAQLNNTLAVHCVAVSNSKRLEYAVELHKMGATPEQVDSTIKFGAPLRGRTRELHSKAVPSMMQSVLQQNQTPAMSQAAVVYDQFVAPLKELHHSEMTKAYWNLPEAAREIIQAVLGRLNSTYLAAAVGLERNRFIQLAAC